MPETYKEYVAKAKKKGTTLHLTRQAWERSKQLAPTMQRRGVKPGFITRAIQKKHEEIKRVIRRKK